MQEDPEFTASLGVLHTELQVRLSYEARHYLPKQTNNNKISVEKKPLISLINIDLYEDMYLLQKSFCLF